jgi:ubiquinone/menaquinone biosynthesis C-methylase UbiE
VAVIGPESVWSQLASWYDAKLAAGSGSHETALPSLLRLVPDVAGAAVLDVACGQGLATRAVAAAGAASVVGVDVAPPMIAIARRRTPDHLPISWRVDDAESLQSFSAATFDGATCQLGLMDIPDLSATLGAIRRVLRARGWFVFVIGHPCFLAPHATTIRADHERFGRLVTHYLDAQYWTSSNPDGIRGRAGNYHRSLSEYLNALLAAGFRLDAVDEPRASPLLLEEQPVYANVPMFFTARATVA